MTYVADSTSYSLLIVDDDVAFAELLQDNLKHLGYRVDIRHEGKEGLSAALSRSYQVVILDVDLPGIQGFDVCRAIRDVDPNIGILFLTAHSADFERVLGLELGGDDYLSKPIKMPELNARLRAILRRVDATRAILRGSASSAPVLRIGELELDVERFSATMAGKVLELTPLEIALLTLLASSPGKAFSREAILREVWGYEIEGSDAAISSLIYRLREKLQSDPSRPLYIRTQRGIGYRFATPEELSKGG